MLDMCGSVCRSVICLLLPNIAEKLGEAVETVTKAMEGLMQLLAECSKQMVCVCLSVRLCVCLSISVSVCPSLCLSACVPALSVSLCLCMCMCVYMFMF